MFNEVCDAELQNIPSGFVDPSSFLTEAAQNKFQTVLRRPGRPSEEGPELDPKMEQKKIGRKSKTGQPPILRGGVQRPREGIKGWVNPFL